MTFRFFSLISIVLLSSLAVSNANADGLSKDDFYCLDAPDPKVPPVFFTQKLKDCGDGKTQTEINICQVNALCTVLTPAQKKMGRMDRTRYFRSHPPVAGQDWFPSTLTCHGKMQTYHGISAPGCPVPEKCREGDVAYQFAFAGYLVDQVEDKTKLYDREPEMHFFKPAEKADDAQ